MELPPQPWVIRRLASEQGRLALWMPVALGLGVLIYFALRFEPPGWWSLSAAPPLGLALWLRGRAPLLAWGAGLVAAMALGFALAAWHGRLQALPAWADPFEGLSAPELPPI